MSTVRDIVRSIQVEVRHESLTPERASHVLLTLTSLLGNCSEEIRIAEMDYNQRLLQCLETDEAANRAKIRAQTSPEYVRLREAKDTKELAFEMTRSLKYMLRVAEEEMRLSR